MARSCSSATRRMTGCKSSLSRWGASPLDYGRVEEAPCALYLVEEADNDEDEESELVNPQQGRRIVALSLQGNTLQVYTNPVEGQFFGDFLCCFDGKLLAPVRRARRFGASNEIVALCGV